MDRFDPDRPDFTPYGFTCVRWQPARMTRFDRHNEIELNLLEQGQLTYLIGGETVVVPAGRLALFWAGLPHRTLEFEGLADYLVVTIPLAWFLQWRLSDHLVQAVLQGEVLLEPDAGQLAADRLRFETWTADLLAGSEERRRIALLELEGRLRRLALSVGEQGAGAAVIDQPLLGRAEAMAAYVAQHFTAPLTADEVGRHVGLHPNYAMVLFRKAFGTTLNRYLTQHRLSHAQRLLVTTSDRILDIAFRSGFGSLSRFNEAFRQSCGCTPGEYRRLHRVP